MWFWADLKITAEEEEQKDSDVVKSAVADVLGINESAVNVECTEDENNAQASNCKVTYPVDVEKPIDFDEQVQKALEDKTGADPGDIEVLGNFFDSIFWVQKWFRNSTTFFRSIGNVLVRYFGWVFEKYAS